MLPNFAFQAETRGAADAVPTAELRRFRIGALLAQDRDYLVLGALRSLHGPVLFLGPAPSVIRTRYRGSEHRLETHLWMVQSTLLLLPQQLLGIRIAAPRWAGRTVSLLMTLLFDTGRLSFFGCSRSRADDESVQ